MTTNKMDANGLVPYIQHEPDCPMAKFNRTSSNERDGTFREGTISPQTFAPGTVTDGGEEQKAMGATFT